MRTLIYGAFLTMSAPAEPLESRGQFPAGKDGSLAYLLIQPGPDTVIPDIPPPLVVFLHGSGERGDDLEKIKAHGPPKQALAGEGLPFPVLAPQCPEGQWWDIDAVIALTRHIATELKCDPKRIYLTGLSMGGHATWDCLAKAPGLFACGVPVCGAGKPDEATTLAGIPIWAFHGEEDEAVKVERTREMETAILAAGGKKLRTTYYPGVGHDSWTRTYGNPAVYAWMMLQSKP